MESVSSGQMQGSSPCPDAGQPPSPSVGFCKAGSEQCTSMTTQGGFFSGGCVDLFVYGAVLPKLCLIVMAMVREREWIDSPIDLGRSRI